MNQGSGHGEYRSVRYCVYHGVRQGIRIDSCLDRMSDKCHDIVFITLYAIKCEMLYATCAPNYVSIQEFN